MTTSCFAAWPTAYERFHLKDTGRRLYLLANGDFVAVGDWPDDELTRAKKFITKCANMVLSKPLPDWVCCTTEEP